MKYAMAKKTYARHNSGDDFWDAFPLPYNDGIDMDLDDKNWFCAYKSIEDLQDWIKSDELKFFISKGFSIKKLDVSQFQVGGEQIAFTKEGVMNETDITDLFDK